MNFICLFCVFENLGILQAQCLSGPLVGCYCCSQLLVCGTDRDFFFFFFLVGFLYCINQGLFLQGDVDLIG